MTRRAYNFIAWTGLLAVAALGMTLRAAHLHFPPLGPDEAESAVNALTILDRGYPAGEYLGQPIFENTLVRPWPDHPEFEFRDVSYSDRGVALYHGWLPLYAMAGSFKAFGIEPDRLGGAGVSGNSGHPGQGGAAGHGGHPGHGGDGGHAGHGGDAGQGGHGGHGGDAGAGSGVVPPRVVHGGGAMLRRTVAARLPAVLFAAAFLALAYLAGRDMFGPDAGAVALVVAALAEPCVRVGRQARYYSATLAVATACCWAVWSVARRGRWRDHLLLGFATAVAFHTHLPTFLGVCGAWAMVLPWALRRPGGGRRVAAAALLVAAAVVPWAIVVGFPGPAADALPPARSLLAMPGDLIGYLQSQKLFAAILLAAALAWPVALLGRWGRLLPARLADPFARTAAPAALAFAFVLLGIAGFWLAAPAPSAFMWRITLAVQGPALLLGAALLAAGVRCLSPRAGAWAAAAVAVALLAGPGSALANLRPRPPFAREPVKLALDHLQEMHLPADARVYALPSQQLPLTLYAGTPIQSIAPVRKTFLDAYAGEVVLIDSAPRRRPVPRAVVAAAAAEAGVALGPAEIAKWASRIADRLLADDLAGTVARVEGGPIDPFPAFAADALERARALPAPGSGDGLWQNPAMFRGRPSYHAADFWPTFFYRFVDPAARAGPNLNYAARMRGATATLLPGGWVVYRSPAPATAATARRGRGDRQ